MPKIHIILGENDLFSTHPHLASEWSSRNTIDSQTVGAWSSRKAWWKCTNGHDHEYETSIVYRAQDRQCSYCSGVKVLTGFNDLATTHSELAARVSPNSEVRPENVSQGTPRKLLWVCDRGHEWEAAPPSQIRGDSCPYCAGKKAFAGFNDLATVRHHLVKEWHPDNVLSPSGVTIGSHKLVKWQCPKDEAHVYEMKVYHRKNRGCPFCAGKQVAEGQSFFDSYPALRQEFAETNTNNPKTISPGSSIPLDWVCSKGHTWSQSAKNRAKGYGCPVCANKKLLVGVNDFATRNKDGIMKEWDYEKNAVNPTTFMLNKGQKSWWKCPKGHSYRAENGNRQNGSGCPRCAKNVSSQEKKIHEFIASLVGEDQVHASDRSIIKPFELDIAVPGKKIAVEFNGVYWHTERYGKGKWYHHEKWKRCRDVGYQLIQVWEDTWGQRPEAVKVMLASALGCDRRPRVLAETMEVVEVPLLEARDFLNSYHIQGWVHGSTYLGLREEEHGLVAVCAFNRVGEDVVLERYATRVQVVDGQSKLLAAYDRAHDYERMVTFADLEVSMGELKENTGWVREGILPPEYRYVLNDARVDQDAFALIRSAEVENLERVWDSGRVRHTRKPYSGVKEDKFTYSETVAY